MTGFENSSIPYVDPHLNDTSLNFLEMDRFRTCVMCLNLLLGPPTHVYILWLIVRGGRLELEFLNVNFSVCEIAISINYFLYVIMTEFPYLSTYLVFAVGLDMSGRPLFQCLMCVERYLAVVHPVTFLKYKPLRYRLVCCMVSWIIIFAVCLFSHFTALRHTIVHMCGLLLLFLFFFSINIFCCLSVLYALKKPGPGERVEENLMKKRAFYLILISTVTMVIMFLPVTILFLLFALRLFAGVSIFQSFSFVCFSLAGFVQAAMCLRRAGKLQFLCGRLQ